KIDFTPLRSDVNRFLRIAFRTDKTLISIDASGPTVYEYPSLRVLQTEIYPQADFASMALSPDRRTMVAASRGGVLVAYALDDVATLKPVAEVERPAPPEPPKTPTKPAPVKPAVEPTPHSEFVGMWRAEKGPEFSGYVSIRNTGGRHSLWLLMYV